MSISHLIANDLEIPVSNIIQEVHVLFQTGCTYKRAWYAQKFSIERCFSPCIDRFLYCRLVISMDGTHLRGPYKSVLLIASTWDANNHLFPLAFAIVDKESSERTETKQWKFDRVIKEIQERNVDAYIYLMKLDPEKWTLLHDCGHRHGIMTTNISEALNNILKKATVLL
ncbi:hypothetical protein M9H77_30824 [Catharanthus roseus]|uniref:Uncharacterized protein n=1 Tax=Catharanthus roseus TaxID=4058 RepID=A0ACB9ZYD0_CATRO|nr:hypothetical protein M9H77_30824 [Catharanthus roseus]